MMSDRNTPGLKGRRPESRPSFFQCLATWAWEISWPGNNSDCWLWTGPMLGVLGTLSHLILTAVLFWQLLFMIVAIHGWGHWGHLPTVTWFKGEVLVTTRPRILLAATSSLACLCFPLSQMKPVHCSKILWCASVLWVWLYDLEGPLKTIRNL